VDGIGITASLSSDQSNGLGISVTAPVLTVSWVGWSIAEQREVCNISRHFVSFIVAESTETSVRPERIETFRARYLRRELARLREQAGLSMEDVAEQTDISKSKLSRIENGKIGVSPSDLRLLLDAYGVTDEASREMLLTFARHARRRGWWYRYADVVSGPYVAMEAEVTELRSYDTQLVPGLFQTEDYYRAVRQARRPNVQTEVIARWWQARSSRQKRLLDADFRIWAVLDESVIRRPVGGPAVTKAQLDRLVEISRQPNVTLQVMPLSAGAHAAMGLSFTILDFPPTDLSIIYLEHLEGDLYLDDDDVTNRYSLVYNHLMAKAMDPDDSAAMIAKAAKTL
jgi:transcriptional regulator with XRE-family HTH domain